MRTKLSVMKKYLHHVQATQELPSFLVPMCMEAGYKGTALDPGGV